MRRVLWAILGLVFGALITPIIAPLLLRVSRPVAKSATKAGLVVFRTGREKLAQLKESMEDILAESHDELDG